MTPPATGASEAERRRLAVVGKVGRPFAGIHSVVFAVVGRGVGADFALFGRHRFIGAGTFVDCLFALEQRIAFDFGLDVVGEFEIRELQQLDGLLQLRRHHQRDALTNFEAGDDGHGAPG